MSEHQSPAAEPGGTTADADEAELIRKVLRAQERHREGGIDPELDTGAPGPGSSSGPGSVSQASDSGGASGAGDSGGAGQGEDHGG